MPPFTGYGSEAEENPRKLLDASRDFHVLHQEGFGTFKLNQFNSMVETADGKLIPFPGVLAIRPVPRLAALQNAREAMGNDANDVWTATKFVPPPAAESLTPEHIFPVRRAMGTSEFTRFCLRRRYASHFPLSGIKTMCLFTDGACANNGSADVVPQAGCGFVFNDSENGMVSFPLEKEGPDGIVYTHTNNRAELRAVIAALEYRVWWGEGWERVIIVTDSEYVVNGATDWMRKWAGREWVTSSRKPVQNRDLWERLSVNLGTYADGGCEVSFWEVPRQWNQQADRAASEAAKKVGSQSYEKQSGVLR
ncbi:putative rnase h domain protein [Mycena sanguinolenta]|uniref:ribonuclease H n=1 Tax=Mycena sanguinolenta TaxID=230812 RepID=A0A8H6XFE1_9AGAR|nr:putative rnase h domain protein [Mycena sanguinolenta]